jgi:hypothetical protein
MKTKKVVKKVTKKVTQSKVTKEVKSVANPFEILEDMSLARTSAMTDPNIDKLIAQINKLEVGNKNQSINIPTTLYPLKKDANNLIRIVKYKFKEEGLGIIISAKTILSNDKKVYLGTRIFRIN